ncbi:hypothetical protein MRX96_054633 [Rhipicephalus microplus]
MAMHSSSDSTANGRVRPKTSRVNAYSRARVHPRVVVFAVGNTSAGNVCSPRGRKRGLCPPWGENLAALRTRYSTASTGTDLATAQSATLIIFDVFITGRSRRKQ